MLTTLIVLTSIFCIAFILGLIICDGELCLISFSILVVIELFGWFGLGTTVTITTKTYIAKSTKQSVEMQNGSFLIFYQNQKGEEKLQQFYQLSDLPLKSAKEFVVEQNFNMYGRFISESVVSANIEKN